MAEPTTVYAVVRDEYDSHETAAMFATRELADAHAADLNDPSFKRHGEHYHYGGWEVEEYKLLAHRPERGSSVTFRGNVMPDGKLVGVSHYQEGDWDYERSEKSVTAELLPGGHAEVAATAYGEAEARALFNGAVEKVREVYAAAA